MTALRFFAALLVFSWHAHPTRQVSATFSLGYAGVSFFFILSGFILMYTYEPLFAGGLQAAVVRRFYLARVARIYPLHLAVMPLMLAYLIVIGGNPVWQVDALTRALEVLAQVFLVQSWFPNPAIHFGGNGPAWSISTEAFFYACFPLLAALASRAFARQVPLAALGAACLLWLAQTLVLAPQWVAVDDWRFYVFPLARLIDFAIGMLVAVAYLRGGALARWPLRPTSIELLAVTAALLCIYVSPVLAPGLHFSADLTPAWAALIFVLACGRGAISRALAHPFLVRLGEISFAFYLLHLAIIAVFNHVLGSDHPAAIPVAFVATLLGAFACFHWIEVPMRAWVRNSGAPLRGTRPALAYNAN